MMLLFSFLGHFLSAYLIYILHQRMVYVETRECVVEVYINGVKR